MKKTLKLAGLLLALVMVISMMPIAAMADDSYTITVNGAINGKDYTAYKVLDIQSYTANGDAAYYTVNPVFDSLFAAEVLDDPDTENVDESKPAGIGLSIFEISNDANKYVTVKGTPTAEQLAAFAKAALEVAEAAAEAEDEDLVSANATAASGTAAITVPSAGYYLVDSEIGSLCALSSTVPTATVYEKNAVPTIAKTVEGAETTTASIGDTVTFTETITIPASALPSAKAALDVNAGAQKFIVTDTMEAGLDLTSSTIVVKQGDATLVAKADGVTEYDYTLAVTDNDFVITFEQDYLDTLEDDTTIVITYDAVLNSEAEICVSSGDAAESNDNSVTLTYGNNITTEASVAKVYTYEFDVVKTDGTKMITGAQFKLYADEDCEEEIAVILEDGVYRVAETGETGTAAYIPAGKATIAGLGNGTYYLKETKQPDGYNILLDPVVITINSASNLATVGNDDTYTSGGYEVENQKGTILPETGGIGTTLFYVIGAILVVGAGVLLVSKKRMAAK